MAGIEIIDEIKRVFAEDEASGKMAVTLADVPHSYDRITPEWMTAVLCRYIPGAAVTGLRLSDESDGSSNRRRINLEYNDAGRAAGLPPSVFCKGSLKLMNRVMLGMSLTAKGETEFFNKVRHRLGIEAPVPLHAAFDPRTHGYILVMKDMGDYAEFCDETKPMSRAEAESMTKSLATLHATFHESPEIGTARIPYMHWADWWIHMMTVSPDFGEKCDIAFGRCEDIIPPRLFKRRAEIWPRTMESAELHRGKPRSLIHCDVHFKNWYKRDGEMGLMDWQIVNVGDGARDFIYALSTSLSVENRRAWLDDLISLYLDTMEARGATKRDRGEFLTSCRQQLLSTLAFWTITLCPAKEMPPMQPDSLTLCFIERICAAMDDLDALDSFER